MRAWESKQGCRRSCVLVGCVGDGRKGGHGRRDRDVGKAGSLLGWPGVDDAAPREAASSSQQRRRVKRAVRNVNRRQVPACRGRTQTSLWARTPSGRPLDARSTCAQRATIFRSPPWAPAPWSGAVHPVRSITDHISPARFVLLPTTFPPIPSGIHAGTGHFARPDKGLSSQRSGLGTRLSQPTASTHESWFRMSQACSVESNVIRIP